MKSPRSLGSLLGRLPVLLGALLLSAAAHAAYPDKPIKLVVGYAPGPGIDYIARLVAQKLSAQLGQTVYVQNQAGANGMVATVALKQAPADGYTLYMATLGHVVNPYVYPTANYDPVRDFSFIGQVVTYPNVLLVGEKSPHKSARDLIAAIRKTPEAFTYGSNGAGSSPHVVGELLARELNVNLQHVPYQTGMPYVDVSTGAVSVVAAPMVSAMTLIKTGKLRGVAVTSTGRAPALPDLPTVSEAGVPGFEMGVWYGVIGPAGMPKPIVQQLNTALRASFADPAVVALLGDQGGVVNQDIDSDAFARFTQAEVAKWAKVFRTPPEAAKK